MCITVRFFICGSKLIAKYLVNEDTSRIWMRWGLVSLLWLKIPAQSWCRTRLYCCFVLTALQLCLHAGWPCVKTLINVKVLVPTHASAHRNYHPRLNRGGSCHHNWPVVAGCHGYDWSSVCCRAWVPARLACRPLVERLRCKPCANTPLSLRFKLSASDY